MKSHKHIAIACAALLLAPAAASAAKKWQKIKTTPMRDITAPKVHREKLDNGIELFVLEDHELPLFRMTLMVKGGAAYNPTNKLGLAGITAEVLRSGGSDKMSGDALDELLESSGSSIEMSSDNRNTTISVNVLIENTEQAVGIVRDLLLQPAYPQDKIDLALTQTRSGIARRNDDPGSIADREFEKLLYGADHPYAQQVEYEHLDAIQRSDLVWFHRQFFHPTEAYVALWGDFQTAEAVALVKRILGEWPKKDVKYPAIPEVPKAAPSVNLVAKESVNQSNIRLGHRSITRHDPDYYALVVMNEILGGGLGSRLFNEVRSKMALAYRAGSGLGAGMEDPGFFQVACGTKSETTVKATKACIEQVRKMKNEPVTDEELQRAKDGLLNSHVFNFANKGAIVNRQMQYVAAGYPADFVEHFAAEVQKVTKTSVQAAAGKFLDPDNFVALVVGKPDAFDEPLSALGEVNEIDVTIPEPKGTAFPEATAETLARGKEIVAQAVKTAGGTKALAAIENLTTKADIQLSMMGQSFPGKATLYQKYPGGSLRLELTVMGQEIVQVFNHETSTGYYQMPMGKKDFDSSEVDQAREQIAQDPINFLRDYAKYEPQYLEEATVDGKATHVVALSPPQAKKFKIFIDKSTNLVVKSEHPAKNPQTGAPVNAEELYSDFKRVGDVQLPHKTKVLHDGEAFMEMTVTSISMTEKIPVDKFAKQ